MYMPFFNDVNTCDTLVNNTARENACHF